MVFTNPALRVGKAVPRDELQPDYFEAEEGFVKLIYGRIRQGKSTESVRYMVECLSNGKAVYSNIALDLNNAYRPLLLDDRVNGIEIIKNVLLFRKRFYKFHNENYNYFDPITGWLYPAGDFERGRQVFDPKKRGDEIRWLNTLTDCVLVYDEGQWLLDSYEKTDVTVEKRKLITETGHVNRTIVLVAQRTQSIHVNARGNVNQFYRCSKKSFLGIVTVLMVEEFQDMKGQDVDETTPISTRRHLFHNRYWHLFNTHYLRRGRPRSQETLYDAFDVGFFGKCVLVFWKIFAFSLPSLKKGAEKAVKISEVSPKLAVLSRLSDNEGNTMDLYDAIENEQSIDPEIDLDIDEDSVKNIMSDITVSLRGERVKIVPTTLKSRQAVPIVDRPDKRGRFKRFWNRRWF